MSFIRWSVDRFILIRAELFSQSDGIKKLAQILHVKATTQNNRSEFHGAFISHISVDRAYNTAMFYARVQLILNLRPYVMFEERQLNNGFSNFPRRENLGRKSAAGYLAKVCALRQLF